MSNQRYPNSTKLAQYKEAAIILRGTTHCLPKKLARLMNISPHRAAWILNVLGWYKVNGRVWRRPE